jgi:glutamine amidotransferase
MIAIVDYGVGNIFSLRSSLRGIAEDVKLTGDPAELRAAEKIILPGVGAFSDAADKLRASGLDQVLIEETGKGKPLLGICLGMQLLFEESHEYGVWPGLGLIRGKVVPMDSVIPANYKIPHIGWNVLQFPENREKSPLFRYVEEGSYVYFVHSFYAAECEESTIGTTEYGAELTAAVQHGNVFGVQFHPEKSGEVGQKILRAFCEMGG